MNNPHAVAPPPLDDASVMRSTATATRAAAAQQNGAVPTNRERFLNACRCRAVDRPPVWLMRQAGRALPEYRALREKHSFLDLVKTPELATEVTLQPVRRFDFDAAILFSDILVIAEALGQPYGFRDSGGIQMEFALDSASAIDRLDTTRVAEKLQYVAEALPLIKSALGGRTALLGFAGSPWTLANFMIEGGSADEWTAAKRLFYTEPALFGRLCEKLTLAVTEYLNMQIDAGADAVQIFDTLGGLLAADAFEAASGRWIRQIVKGIAGRVPVIVFAKGVHSNWGGLVNTDANVLGVDWTFSLAELRATLPDDVGIQGNLDPLLLTTTPEAVAAETTRLLRSMSHRPGYIFNLGHGVPPAAKIECIESLVKTIQTLV
jgi:uroporphyrinogen decarboxylase